MQEKVFRKKTQEKKLSALRKVCRAFVRRPDKEFNQLCRINLQNALKTALLPRN